MSGPRKTKDPTSPDISGAVASRVEAPAKEPVDVVKFVESFFSRWDWDYISTRKEKRWDTNSSLYNVLLDENITKKIILTDDEISQFGSAPTSLYTRNRIFLHAILVSPEKWTNLFAALFRETCESKGPDERQAGDSMHSYHFWDQLRYLHGIREGARDNERPSGMILLPAHAQSREEWVDVLSMTDESKRQSTCQSNLDSFRNMLNSECRGINMPLSKFIHRLFHEYKLSDQYNKYNIRIDWIAICGRAFVEGVNTVNDLLPCLLVFSAEKYPVLVGLLGDRLKRILETGEFNFTSLTECDRPIFLRALGPELVKIAIRNTPRGFTGAGLTVAQVLDTLGDGLKDVVNDYNDLLVYFAHGENVKVKIIIALGRKGVDIFRQAKQGSGFVYPFPLMGHDQYKEASEELLRLDMWSSVLEDWAREFIQLDFDRFNTRRKYTGFPDERKKKLIEVLAEARTLTSLGKPDRALVLLDAAYHHPLFSDSESVLISKMNSVATSFTTFFGGKDSADQSQLIESGSQTTLRQLREEIKLKSLPKASRRSEK